jgi:hypothetical protein
VFNGQHLAAAARQASAQHGFGDEFGSGRDLDYRIQVGAAENYPCLGHSRAQREKHLLAAVQPDAGGADDVLDGALLEHAGSRLVRLMIHRKRSFREAASSRYLDVKITTRC